MKKIILLVTIVLVLMLSGCIKESYVDSSSPKDLISITNILKENGILSDISEEKFNSIRENIRSGKIKSLIDVLIFADKILLFETNKSDVEPPNHYESVFNKLKSLNNEIEYESFNEKFIKVKNYDYDDDEFDRILVSFEAGGIKYENAIYYSSENFIIPSDFYKILNRLLADKNSAYRFYEVRFYEISELGLGSYVHNRFGIISLTKEQADFLRDSETLYLSYYEHDILSTEEMNNYLNEFKKLGLFNHLDESTFLKEKEELFRQTPTEPLGVLNMFSNTTYWFDTETSNFENPYEEIILRLSEISHGVFEPKEIIDKFRYDETTTLSFVLSGKEYETMVETSGDWLDISFIDLINNALEGNQISGKFYLIETGGQDVLVIFLTDSQLTSIKKNILLQIVIPKESTAVEKGKEYEEQVIRQIEENIK